MEKRLDKLDERQRLFLTRIPVLEDQRIFQLIDDLRVTHNLSTTASNIECRFGFDLDFLDFVEAHSSPDNPNKKLMIFSYFLAIGYGCDSSVDKTLLTRVLRVLKFVPPDIRKDMFSFALAIVLEKASNFGIMHGEDEIFMEVCDLIAKSANLSHHIFPVVVHVFRIIGAEGAEKAHIHLQKCIEEMVASNHCCLHDNDVGELIDCLSESLNELNVGTLIVLATAAQKCIFHDCDKYLKLVNARLKSYADDVYFQNPIDSSHAHSEEVFGTPNAIPSISFEFHDEMDMISPVYDSVTSSMDLQSFFGVERYEKMLNFIQFGTIWPKSMREHFPSIYQHDLISASGNILFYVAAIAMIAQRVNDPAFTQAVVSVVLCTEVFSENVTVFRKETMDERVNFVRNLVIDTISNTHPACIAQVFNMCIIYPVLLTENLLRVLLRFKKYDPSIFVQEPLRTILAQTCLNLINLKSDIAVTVRSCFFDFLFTLISQPEAASGVLSSEVLLHVYFRLVFEKRLTNIALSYLKRCIASARVSDCMSHISSIFAQIIAHCRMSKDVDFQLKIVDTLVGGLEFNKRLSIEALVTWDEILVSVIEFRDEVLLTYALAFISFVYSTKPSFSMNKERFSQLYLAVISTFPEVLPAHILTRLWCILGDVSFVESKTAILIRNHMALPWIFAVCAHYPNFPDVLRSWIGLCKFSFNNRISFHKGLVDSLLLQYLANGPVTYKCIPIEVNDSQEVRQCACKLLPRIVTEETNFEIAYRLCNLLRSPACDPMISKLFTRIVAAGASAAACVPNIPLDSCFPILEIRNIPWDSLKNHFTFDVIAKYDEVASLRIDSRITILKLTDDETTLEFYLHNTMISCMYQHANEPPIVSHLFRNVMAAEWMRMTTVVTRSSRKPPQYRVFSLHNGDRLCETVMNSDIVFNSANFRLIIGGSDQSPENHPTFFEFKDFRIYPFIPVDEDLREMESRSRQMLEQALYSSIDKVEGTMLPFYHETRSLLSYMCEGNLPNAMVEFASLPMLPVTIDFCSYMFRISPAVQEKFTAVEVLLEKMMKARDYLHYDLYYSLYSTLGSITYLELQVEWFEKLVMNVWIWAHCDQSQFEKIIYHWKTNLIPRYAGLLKRKSYFSQLLTQFTIIFCIEQETDTGFFQKSLTNKFSASCADSFMNFLLSVSRLNFNAEDFDLLFSFATSAKPEYQVYFVKFLSIVSKNLVIKERMTAEHFSLLHQILHIQDRTLVPLVIIALHDLSIDHVLEHMVAASYEVLSYDCIENVFTKLLTKLKFHPGVMAFMTVTGLHLGQKYLKQLAIALTKIEHQRYRDFVRQENWHIFFILLLYNIPTQNIRELCVTFAHALMLCENPSYLDRTLAIMIRLRAWRSNRNPIHYLLAELKPLIKDEMATTLVKFSYYNLFLHLEEKLHSDAVLAELAKSPFHTQCEPECQANEEPLGIATLEAFMDDGLFDFNVFFHLYLNEDGSLSDADLKEIVVSLLPHVNDKAIDNSMIENQLMFFTNKTSMPIPEQVAFLQHLDHSIDKRKKEFIELLSVNLKVFQTGFLDTVLSARNIVSLCDQGSEERKLGHLMLVHVSKEMQRLKPVDQIGEEKTTQLKRRNFVGVSYVPTRRKPSHASKRVSEVASPAPSGTEFSCSLLSLGKKKKYDVYIGPRRLLFKPCAQSGKTKIVPCNLVKMLFSRPHLDAFEFFLVTGQQYLVQFESKDVQSVLEKLKALKFWPAEYIQLNIEKVQIAERTQKWCDKEISNLEYIMFLNMAAGFSFRDASCYPVAPPVLTDFNNQFSMRTTYRGLVVNEVNAMNQESLESTFVRQGTVPADFYFDPLAIPEHAVLPDWASSRHEFVYRARQILESPSISMILSQWIDRVFGWRCRHSSRKLFSKEHPQRNVVEEIQFKDYEIKLEADVRHVVRTSIEKTKVVLGIVQKSNRIYRVTFSFASSGCSSTLEDVGEFDSRCDDLYFGQTNHQVIAYSQSRSTLFVVSDAKVIQQIPFFAKSTIFASLGISLVFTTDKCTLSVCVFLPDGKCNVRHLCSATSEITDLAANPILQIVAFSTMDGVVHIYDVRSGECLGEHKTNKEITQVLVTQNWGFVVAICSDELFVYSQNGEFLKSQNLEEPISRAFPFALFSGFDFLAFQNKNMEIVVFEAFRPEKHLVASRCPYEVVIIMYDQYRSNFIVVSKKGIVKMIPYHLANYVC